jgi:Bacteroidetes VLRF1 release factor
MPAATFHWTTIAQTLRALDLDQRLYLERDGRWFESADRSTRVVVPLVAPIPSGCRGVDEYLAAVPVVLGRHLVILMQAGAVALGVFDLGEVVATKAFKRYVVRGTGRAQPTHLATKGKSRYGSRLRLQNATRLLEETNEKLGEWRREIGDWEAIFVSCPVKLWPSLWEVEPAPPFERDRKVVRIPKDLPRPTTEVLLRTYRGLLWGRVERTRDGG